MKKIIKLLTATDWVAGSASLAWGLYAQNGWYIAGGLTGLLAAYFKPAVRMQAALEKRFLRKKVGGDSAQIQAEDEFYATMLGQSSSQPAAAQENAPATDAAPDFSRTLQAGPTQLSGSRHNVLKPEVFNLASSPNTVRHWA